MNNEPTKPARSGDRVVVERENLDHLFAALKRRGYQVVGPTRRDGAIVYDWLKSSAELPAGWTDAQEGGKYRLQRRADQALFGYAVGPQSWKRFLFPPVQKIYSVRREGKNVRVISDAPPAPPQAFIGVRACELQAIAVQDKVFFRPPGNPVYQQRRNNLFLVAVQCGKASGSCFCASMRCGPKVTTGFDLSLTELVESGRHRFVVEAGSQRGLEVLFEVPHAATTPEDLESAEKQLMATTRQMGRTLDPRNLKELLYRNLNHSRWEDVGARCLACGNCTMVCPTCFCSAVQDVADLGGETVRQRVWDSCFTLGFSELNGGQVRITNGARYRHWLVHKLAAWHDQFNASGCVGCGRCITWCPVGIDLTEEIRLIRESEPASARQLDKRGQS